MTAEALISREQDLDQLRRQIRQKIEQARLALQSHRVQEAAGRNQAEGSMVIESSDPRIRRQRFFS